MRVPAAEAVRSACFIVAPARCEREGPRPKILAEYFGAALKHRRAMKGQAGSTGMGGSDDLPSVAYCWTWNFRRDRVGVALSVQEAEERHNSGEEYTAVLSSGSAEDRPVLVTIVWKNDYASTEFLDGLGRPHMKYEFLKKACGELFLGSVWVWNYPDGNPRLSPKDFSVREEVHYREDGYARHVVIDKEANVQDITEYTGVPVAANWEPVPRFGHYESIARRERD